MAMRLSKVVSIFLTGVLLACTAPPPEVKPEKAQTESAPEAPPIKETVPPKPVRPSDTHRVAAYYAAVQARLLSQGRMRKDINPADARFDVDDLVRNFTQVALYDEYILRDGEYIEKRTPSYVRRWSTPLRIGLHFGQSVSSEQRKIDSRNVGIFARRLANLSGLDIQFTKAEDANFLVLFLNKDEQIGHVSSLADMNPRIIPSVVHEIERGQDGIFCAAYALADAGNASDYTGAIILIKSENTGLMRLSCIHEEMTQALGLANDSPRARPSIFNDDEEFALLTRHDEILLQMLYDPRLKPGMTESMARPLLRRIAEDILAANAS